MPHHLKKLTPNLIVSDVSRSIAFYRDVLGFSLAQTVPDAEPFVFAIVRSGDVEIFLNAPDRPSRSIRRSRAGRLAAR